MSFKLHTLSEYIVDAFPPTTLSRLEWYLNYEDKEAFKKEYGISVYSFVKRFATFKYIKKYDYFYVKKIKICPHLTWASWE